MKGPYQIGYRLCVGFCVWILGFLLCVQAVFDEFDRDQIRLNYDLFHRNRYNKLIRPVKNTSDSLNINFTLTLSAIINVDEKNQVMVTNVWLEMIWRDYQLVWNASEYGNIDTIKMPNIHIWVPDVVLFNNADGNFEPSYTPNCVIRSEGSVQFVPPAIFTSSCSIDVEYFPFDQQVCEMKFGSWTFEGKTLTYTLSRKSIDLATYMKNGAWDIINGPGRIEVIRDPITSQDKQIVVFELVLRRKTLFYTVNLIIPCFLHAISCLCVFVLPADGCEKITLVISVLVSLVVLLLVLQKILPPSMTIPLVAKYFLFTFIMNVLEILVTVMVIYANHKTPRIDSMPYWVGWLFLYKLPKYLFMTRPDHEKRWQPKTCTPPPSYPSTPVVPRANIALRETQDMRMRKLKQAKKEKAAKDSDRVNMLRQQFSTSRFQGLFSSSASGSRVSEDSSPIDFPTNGHRCMLRDSGTSQSEDSLVGDHCSLAEPNRVPPPPCRPQPHPLIMTKEIYSASNAIKFICHQMRNKGDYDEVLDDWKYVAAVCDRLLMLVYVLVTLGGTLGILMNAPHILETVDQDEIIASIQDTSNSFT